MLSEINQSHTEELILHDYWCRRYIQMVTLLEADRRTEVARGGRKAEMMSYCSWV